MSAFRDEIRKILNDTMRDLMNARGAKDKISDTDLRAGEGEFLEGAISVGSKVYNALTMAMRNHPPKEELYVRYEGSFGSIDDVLVVDSGGEEVEPPAHMASWFREDPGNTKEGYAFTFGPVEFVGDEGDR